MSQSTLAINASPSASTFSFGTHNVRVVMRDGEPWFVAADVAEALGYRNAPDAARNLGEHQKASTQIVRSTAGGNPNLTIINESGLYRLVLRSRKPEAEKFSDWVTGEVLPSLRKTGSYQSQPLAQRTECAHLLASKATAQVFDTVFQAAMRDDFHPVLDRILLSLHPTDDAVPQALLLERNAIVTTVPHLIHAVASDLHISTADLTHLALACTQRLAARTPSASQQGNLQLR